MRNGAFVKSLVAVAAVAAILLAGVPARGAAGQAADAGVCPEAQRCLALLQDGIALIEGGRWDAASVLLGEVAAGLEGRPSHARDLALAYVYLGVARLQVSDADEARQWFAEAQMRDPTLRLDPADFPRDVLELWAEARNLGMLLVDSEPSGAEVSVDGLVRGRSPVGVAGLKAGAHRVALSYDGYAGVSRVLTVAAGRTERLFVPLVPAPGAVETRSAAPLTGLPDGVSASGLSFGDAAVEQAPVNVFPIPDRFPVGTTKKSGRSWWRTLAGVLGVAGGVALLVEGAQCRGGGKKFTGWLGYGETRQVVKVNAGRQIEFLGGRLDTFYFGPRDRVACEGLAYDWYWERPDGLGFGAVVDHAAVTSGTYDPLSSLYEGRVSGNDGDSLDLARQMGQDPSFVERLPQALVQSVGDIGVGYRVPPEWLVPGAALVAVGALFATLWADVTVVEDLALDITPSGGVLASRSFGW